MQQDPPVGIVDYLLRPGTYHGDLSPEALAFNSNLQIFARRVDFICGLQTNGKIDPAEALDRIRRLWADLDASARSLGVAR